MSNLNPSQRQEMTQSAIADFCLPAGSRWEGFLLLGARMLNRPYLRSEFKKERLLLGINPPIDPQQTHEVPENQLYSAFMVIVTILLASLLLLFSFGGVAHASVIPENKAILSIIGEAENQGYTGMLALACAIRNRGTLKGVYGLHASRVITHKYNAKTYAMAQKAWLASAKTDITHGATGWGNKEDLAKFEKCAWWKNCVVVYSHLDHIFYRKT